MEKLKFQILISIMVTCVVYAAKVENKSATKHNISRQTFSFNRAYSNDDFSSVIPFMNEKSFLFMPTESVRNVAKKNISFETQRHPIKRYDDQDSDLFSYTPSVKFDTYWVKLPTENVTARRDSIKKHDSSITWPTWSSKKEIYQNNGKKKNRKYYDSIEDYLGADSRYHEMADRKYIHEHEGFFFPIHVPSSHHERDDHLIPLLLLLLLPLLLFAIIIPLNANLLSTLFLIMQNNGATTTAAQLAAAAGRRKRHLYEVSHPVVEERIMEALRKLSSITEY